MVGHGHLFIGFQRVLDHISIEEALQRYRDSHFENASVTIYKLQMVRRRPQLALKEENIVPWKDKI